MPTPFEPVKEIAYRKPYHVGAVLPGYKNSILTLSVQPSETGTLAYLEYLFFDQPGSEAAKLVALVREGLRRV